MKGTIESKFGIGGFLVVSAPWTLSLLPSAGEYLGLLVPLGKGERFWRPKKYEIIHTHT